MGTAQFYLENRKHTLRLTEVGPSQSLRREHGEILGTFR
jgi:hypothetical protein